MAPTPHLVLLLLYGWTHLSAGQRAPPRADAAPDARGTVDVTGRPAGTTGGRDTFLRDAMTEHMQTLYAKYNRAGFRSRDGNTVRSFKAHWGTLNNKRQRIFNLTSLTESEDVLSATLHYYVGDLRNATRGHAHIHVLVWSLGAADDRARTLGHFRIDAPTTLGGGSASWRWRDITRLVNRAKSHGELRIGIDVRSRGPRLPSDRAPYILIYADDSAISEPESVVATLRRRRPAARGAAPHQTNGTARGRPAARRRRSANVLLPLQNNELPGPEYPYEEAAGWDEADAYQPPGNGQARRPRKKPRKGQRSKMSLLQFDEQTIKKARKKQWNEPRNCARRYLKVDFADIGWSEWIISPKSFDAYYCSGSCQFPMAKALKPSNHATIQSIVRAVGVVPGIPEPCCVPEKMSSLSILFFDEDKNVVLKVYPNMTVDSCACR